MVFEVEMRYGLAMQKPFVLACVLLASYSLQAVPSTELKAKYEPIIQRNPFGLKPIIAPPVATNTQPKPPEPKSLIYLTGITSIGYPKYPKKAYLLLKEEAGKKETNYLSFVEGQKQKDIEVLAINEKDRTVRIRNSDGEILLSFKTHGITNAVAAVPTAGRPGAPGIPMPGSPGGPGAIPPPPALPGAQPPTAAVGGTGPQPIASDDYSRPTIQNSNMRGVASRRRSDLIAPAPAAAPAVQGQPGAGQQGAPQVDAAQQYINLLAEEEMARRRGDFFPPTPPP